MTSVSTLPPFIRAMSEASRWETLIGMTWASKAPGHSASPPLREGWPLFPLASELPRGNAGHSRGLTARSWSLC
jgi:hypothetical protein